MAAADLNFSLSAPERGVNTEFVVPAGTTMGLIGPNGSGKSTCLESIAGWLSPHEGHAILGETVLFDTRDGTHLAPHRRRIGYLRQSPLLFPHLSVAGNIRYGLKRSSTPRAEYAQAVSDWLERVELPGFDNRKTSQLSGGQAQRVAIARVLASEPNLVLLDEPLAPVDYSAAGRIRELLAKLLADRTTIVVTHHDADLDALADSVHSLG